MTSFAVAIEPRAHARLAAHMLLFHGAAAASPWIARCGTALAIALTVFALLGLAATLARIPGPHCRLARFEVDADGCRSRLRPADALLPTTLGPGTRAYSGLVVLEVVVQGRRHGWLLPRSSLPADEFRRLKARIRLAC
jgi:hypothetical protein